MKGDLLVDYMASLKAKQEEISRNNCLINRPAEVMYVEAGKYQGIQLALETLESFLRDELNQEAKI